MNDQPPHKWINFGLAQIVSKEWYEWKRNKGIADPFAVRHSLPRKLRLSIIERDGHWCGICLMPVDPTDVDIDHKIPVALGGTDHPENLQVSHSFCNRSKGARI